MTPPHLRDSKWRARRYHHVAANRTDRALGRMATWSLAGLVMQPLAAVRRTAWTVFGHRRQLGQWGFPMPSSTDPFSARRAAGDVGGGDARTDHLRSDIPAAATDCRQGSLEPLFLCMCCAQPIRGSEFVETRSGLRRHVTCPPASTWGDERLDRLWDEIQASPPLDILGDPKDDA